MVSDQRSSFFSSHPPRTSAMDYQALNNEVRHMKDKFERVWGFL